ncbi:hypothetical protein SAMN02745121_09058 [Nannocystis exedens]|uniref:Uncharacterized protein n=1 Tax=Nannocystis exedens TaxID=54 RepID=A0A1I2IWP5_9BACT|nr:hypothetical protein [Nannocystis exedens]PCC68811.1 hypothetical protein NAEX_01831 [Nannocystis exedens]SFF46825.1 hypothetical protein SAMN02745121_09058 [Nannocystis exedens]
MATPVLRYRFVLNTSDLGAQLERNWRAIIPRVEKTYGNTLLKQLVPGFKVGGTSWAERLAALRERVKAGPAIVPKALKGIYESETWLLAALQAEAKKGPHPGTSLLELELEALPGGGAVLAPKRDKYACMRQVAVVLCDFAPDSPMAGKLARAVEKDDVRAYPKEFQAVIRSEGAGKTKGKYALLAVTELLKPFKAGRGKAECYAC